MLSLVFILAACQDGTSESSSKENTDRQTALIQEIDSLENVLENDQWRPNNPAVPTLMQSYTKYSELYPGDLEKSPEYLYKSAALARSVQLPVKAIKIYDKILVDYPKWMKAPEVAFLLAFTYDEDLKEPDLAKEAYQKLIQDFPGDHWAVQAEQRLVTIDMSDDELLEFLNSQSQSDS